jgi:hypothetical protein
MAHSRHADRRLPAAFFGAKRRSRIGAIAATNDPQRMSEAKRMVIETWSRLAPAYTVPSHSAGAASSPVNTEAIVSNTPSRRTSAWNRAAARCNRISAKNAKAR